MKTCFFFLGLLVASLSLPGCADKPKAAAATTHAAPLAGPLSRLATATIGTGLNATLRPDLPVLPETELRPYVFGRTNDPALVHGLCWARPGGEEELPSLAAILTEVEPFRLLAADFVELKLPGATVLTALRVRISVASETNRRDRTHYRFYGLNPWQPAMPLLLDGLWLANRTPDPQSPETDMVQTIQDWRTGFGADLLTGGWARNLESYSPEAEQSAFDTNGQYRHFSPELGFTEGLWARCGEAIGLLPLRGASNGNAPRSPLDFGTVRSRQVFDGGRACWARWMGDAPAPDGCFVRVP